jgi:lipopolysaccharide export system permease protein
MRLSPILSVYIGRQFLVAFLAVLMVIMGLILLFDLIELMRRAAAHPDAGFGLLLGMALMKLPQMMHTVLPFAVMIGSMVAFWRLTRSHELVVARAAGVSVWQFLGPVVIIVAALGIVNVVAFNPLASAMYARFERLQDDLLLRRSNPLTLSESGLWLRETQDEVHAVVHADQVRQEGMRLYLRDVSIFMFDGPDQFSHRIDAASGELADKQFDLRDVWVMRAGRPSEHHDGFHLKTTLTLDTIQDNFASPETVSFWQLPRFIDFFESAGFSAVKHRLYWQSLMASPLLLCAMVLIAAIFSLNPNMRSGGMMMRVGGGVVSGFLLYFFSKVIYAFGLSSTLPQLLAAWSPAMVTALLGMTILLYLEDG